MVMGMNGFFVSEFSGWDQASDNDIQLYDAVLKRDMGIFPAGTKVDLFIGFWYDTETPKIEIYQDSTLYTFEVEVNTNIDRYTVQKAGG